MPRGPRGREATRQSDRPRPGFIVPSPMMLGCAWFPRGAYQAHFDIGRPRRLLTNGHTPTRAVWCKSDTTRAYCERAACRPMGDIVKPVARAHSFEAPSGVALAPGC